MKVLRQRKARPKDREIKSHPKDQQDGCRQLTIMYGNQHELSKEDSAKVESKVVVVHEDGFLSSW